MLPNYLNVTETVKISKRGKSVLGVANAISDYMKLQDALGLVQYPSQYSVSVDDETIYITRNYNKKIEIDGN